MSKGEITGIIPSPDCVSFLEGGDAMLGLPHNKDVELLLSDRMFDEIGRALEDYSYAVPMSVCPSPRTESPWPFAPQLISSSSASTLFSNPDYQFDMAESPDRKLMKKPSKKRKPQVDGETATDSASSVEAEPKKRSKKRPTSEAAAAKEKAITSGLAPDVAPPKKKKSKAPPSDKPLSERSRKSSSSYRGVSLCTKDSRWQARIRIKKEVVYLGRFETEEAAARRYDEAAREHHGDKALINFITSEDRALGRKSVFEQVGGKSARV